MDAWRRGGKPTVLVVDDTPDNLILISNLLGGDYRVKLANSAARGLAIARSDDPPDLILLDIMMPEMDGYQACLELKRDPQTAYLPVIFLTAKSEMQDEQRGLALGAADYITKPINPPILLARVATHLQVKQAADVLRDRNLWLEEEVQRRTREITAIQDVTILAMASLAETRDSDTGNHIRRTQHYIRALARHVRDWPRFSGQLSDATIDMLFKSAPLHDIGKVGIPDRILLKPGKLTADEFTIMQTHTTLGYEAINHAEQALGTEVGFLEMAKQIALSHQEKWDGSGYPQGLAGEQIPLAARLMAVADVYDALICRRVYKAPMAHAQAVSIILQGRGSHFDPDLVDGFMAIEQTFQTIAQQYADSEESLQNKQAYLDQARGDHP